MPTAPAARRTICVLGFHRSGTSLLERVHGSSGEDTLHAIARTIPDLWWSGRSAARALAQTHERQRETTAQLEHERDTALDELRTALDRHARERSAAAERIRALERERELRDHQLAVNRDELNAIYGSVSWRLTALLRGLKTRVGRPAR